MDTPRDLEPGSAPGIDINQSSYLDSFRSEVSCSVADYGPEGAEIVDGLCMNLYLCGLYRNKKQIPN